LYGAALTKFDPHIYKNPVNIFIAAARSRFAGYSKNAGQI
jgi:hypothetical protein